mmetsp:Transcript_5775/g.8898  ORF Transcript_5775/g.8898 Transcript_5775/m.8898 type:complete len:88 (-) Transcript_5775:1002-1265(-)
MVDPIYTYRLLKRRFNGYMLLRRNQHIQLALLLDDLVQRAITEQFPTPFPQKRLWPKPHVEFLNDIEDVTRRGSWTSRLVAHGKKTT